MGKGVIAPFSGKKLNTKTLLRQIFGVQLFKSRTLFVSIYEFFDYLCPAVGGSLSLSTDDPTKEVVRMLLVLILITTGVLLSQMTITSGGGTI